MGHLQCIGHTMPRMGQGREISAWPDCLCCLLVTLAKQEAHPRCQPEPVTPPQSPRIVVLSAAPAADQVQREEEWVLSGGHYLSPHRAV